MLLADLVATSARLAATRSRLEKTRLLADLLRRARGREIELVVDYLSGVLPQGRIGVGWSMLQRAESGGGGAAAAPSLALVEVDAAFERLRSIAGAGSQEARIRELAALLARATADERSFLVRLLGGELRQGALEGAMEEGIIAASGLPKQRVRHAIMVAGSAGEVARAALEEGEPGSTGSACACSGRSNRCWRRPATTWPRGWRSSARRRSSSSSTARGSRSTRRAPTSRSTRAACATSPGRSRRWSSSRARFPLERLILDGEAIALRADGRPHPFQVTMRRFGRRLDVDAMRVELPLDAYFFDALHVDGDDLLAAPASERFARMAEVVPAARLVPRRVTSRPEEAAAFLAEALDRGHEGIMAKDLASPYEAGSRGSAWLKIKRAHTLDLVILAAEWGHGRRQGWLSNLHLGARDLESGAWVMLGKTFKGLTDEMLAWQTQRLLELETSRDSYTVYVEPTVVVEIAFNDVQESPRYPGGFALRLARVKAYRPDKTPADADTFDRVRAIWEAQVARESVDGSSEG